MVKYVADRIKNFGFFFILRAGDSMLYTPLSKDHTNFIGIWHFGIMFL